MPSLFQQFEQFINELVLQELTSQSLDSDIVVKASSDNHETINIAAERKPILWVTQTGHSLATPDHSISNPQVDSCAITLDSLAKSPPNRHSMICFWLPEFSHHELNSLLPSLIRSRDLDADSTIAVLDSTINLRPFGFVELIGSPLDSLNPNPSDNLASNNSSQSDMATLTSDDSHEPTLKAWQFNLYDYKPLPQWLNANYWANPENWGKYRW